MTEGLAFPRVDFPVGDLVVGGEKVTNAAEGFELRHFADQSLPSLGGGGGPGVEKFLEDQGRKEGNGKQSEEVPMMKIRSDPTHDSAAMIEFNVSARQKLFVALGACSIVLADLNEHEEERESRWSKHEADRRRKWPKLTK